MTSCEELSLEIGSPAGRGTPVSVDNTQISEPVRLGRDAEVYRFFAVQLLENFKSFGKGCNCGDWRGIAMRFLTRDTNLRSTNWFSSGMAGTPRPAGPPPI